MYRSEQPGAFPTGPVVFYDEACTDYPVNGEKVIFEVTNNGNAAVSFVSAYVLFYNGNEVVDYDYAYAIDDDNELKPGATLIDEASTTNPSQVIAFSITDESIKM